MNAPAPHAGDLPDWLVANLACPVDAGPVTAAAGVLECGTCRRTFSVEAGIPRMVVEAATRSTAQTQQRVYDARNAQASAWAQEAGFAMQLIYRRDLLLDTLRRLGIPTPRTDDERWVYVGGGEGTQCMVLSQYGGRHISLDISATQLELGRWLAEAVAPAYLPQFDPSRLAFVQADGEASLPFRRGCADVAYGLGVLNHLPPDLWAAHIRSLQELLKPGGVAFEVVPNLECEIFRTPLFTEQFRSQASMQYWTQFVTEPRVVEAFTAAGLERVQSARLWHLNHDAAARHVSRLDGLVRRAAERVGLRWRYPLTRACQQMARATGARPWNFSAPRHLVVAGWKPLADG